MRECEAIWELLSASLDDMLTDGERARLDAHLAACPDCRALLRDLTAIRAGLADLTAEPPPALHADIMAAVEKAQAMPAPAGGGSAARGGWRRWGALAAMLALAVTVGFFAFLSGAPGRSGGSAPSAAAPFAVPGGEYAYSAAPESAPESGGGDAGLRMFRAEEAPPPAANVFSDAVTEDIADGENGALAGNAGADAAPAETGLTDGGAQKEPARYFAVVTLAPPTDGAGKRQASEEIELPAGELQAILDLLERNETAYSIEFPDADGDTVLLRNVPVSDTGAYFR